jgi:WD40 repeat protein/tRNA A-37 threonylcarbamoyl transferase component Bud32
MAFSSTLFCDTCGAANRAQALFCAACGRYLQAASSSMTARTFTGLLTQQHMLKQRYRILGQAGKGGFGAVYKAQDTQFGNRLLAIKEMSQSNLNSQELAEATQAFKREALLLANLTHPNLPRIYEQFSDMGRWYLVMDFIEGETLEAYLDTRGGKLPLMATGASDVGVLNIGIQLCSVLNYLHTRQPPIIFRDLKPANIMLTADGHIFLIDFGIARHFKPGQVKDTTALGSTGYAAPEQYGRAQTTPRADIYSLGATLHQMLSGDDPAESPFHFAPLSGRHTPVLADLNALLMRMLEVDNSRRPATVAGVQRELQRIADIYRVGQTHPLASTLPPGYSAARNAYNPQGSYPLVTSAPVPSTISQPQAKLPRMPQPQKNTLFICAGHSSRVTSVAWSPNGTHLASASYDKTIRLWNATNGQHIQTYRGHSGRVNALAWSPDSSRFISASDDGSMLIWNTTSKNPLFTFSEHTGKVIAVAWSPDGSRIASAGINKVVLVWEVATGRILFTFNKHSYDVTTLAWSPSGTSIASGSDDCTIQVWEPLKDGYTNFFTSLFAPQRRIYTYSRHHHKVTAVAWSPDGRRIASTSADRTMQVWDVGTGKLGFIYHNSSASMNAVAWSSDGHYLAAASNDKTVHVWDSITRNSIATYLGHIGYVTAVAWSPDRTAIASASVDRTVQVWKPM